MYATDGQTDGQKHSYCPFPTVGGIINGGFVAATVSEIAALIGCRNVA